MAAADVDVSVVVIAPSGEIECEDPANGYELHADSFATVTYTHRKVEVNGPWIKGTYATDSVLDNALEALVVWVSGNDSAGNLSHYLFQTRLNALMAGFDQLSYTVVRTIGDSQEIWDCEVADYTVETQQEFIVATTGVLRVQLPRRPDAPITQLTPATTGWWARAFIAETLALEVLPLPGDPPATSLVLAGLLP